MRKTLDYRAEPSRRSCLGRWLLTIFVACAVITSLIVTWPRINGFLDRQVEEAEIQRANDPRLYPAVRWYNATWEPITLRDDQREQLIQPGKAAELIVGDARTPWTIITPNGPREYEKHLPAQEWQCWPGDHGDYRVFIFQFDSDGAVLVVPRSMRPPVAKATTQPEGFPLSPRTPAHLPAP